MQGALFCSENNSDVRISFFPSRKVPKICGIYAIAEAVHQAANLEQRVVRAGRATRLLYRSLAGHDHQCKGKHDHLPIFASTFHLPSTFVICMVTILLLALASV